MANVFGALANVFNQDDVFITVNVRITNKLAFSLVEPVAHLIDGNINVMAPLEIAPDTHGNILFQKTPFAAFGAKGAFTYTVEGQGVKAAIYYENPYAGNNWYGLRWSNEDADFSMEMVQAWENDKEELDNFWEVGNNVQYNDQVIGDYRVMAAMTHGVQANLHVEFKPA